MANCRGSCKSSVRDEKSQRVRVPEMCMRLKEVETTYGS